MDRKLLIVEDDAITALSIKKSLEDYGYSADVAYSGSEALNLIKNQNNFELILMDIDLGEKPDGTETAEQILAEKEIPIIFHSSHTEPEITAKTEKITSYGYVVKNTGITVLDASIKMAFRLFDSRQKEKEKEDELRETKNRFELYLNSSPYGIFIADEKGCYTEVNNTAVAMTGFTREELIGMHISDVLAYESRQAGLESFSHLKETGTLSECLHYITKQGRIRIWHIDAIQLSETRFLGFTQDITEKSNIEKSLSESEIRYREMFENMNNCVAIYEAVENGADFIIKDFNSAAEKIEHVKREDIINKPVTKVFTGIKALGLLEVFKEVWQTGKPKHHPLSFYEGNRISGWRENYVYKLPSDEVVAIYEDKTQIMQAQEALQRSEEQFRNVLMDLSFIVVTIDQNGKLIFCNNYFLKITGWRKEEIIGKSWFDTCLPEDIRLKVLNDTFTAKQKQTGPPPKYENEILTKNGERRLIIWSNTVFRNTADLTPTFTSVGEDITAQMLLARQQEEIIHEKEIILKEVHHRIKNNMATMKSLLEIQAYSLKDDSAQKLLHDAAGRMNSMMLLYDRLYTSENIDSFSFSEYLESLVNDIVASASVDIELKLELQEIIIPVHSGSILGIIINEIITNSIKYAFSKNKKNILSIKVKKLNKQASFIIRDNGPGFDPSEIIEGFGHSLIKELTLQLKGEMDLSAENGTAYTFLFPIEESVPSQQ